MPIGLLPLTDALKSSLARNADGAIAFGPRFTANHPAETPHKRYEVIQPPRQTGGLDRMAINQALRFLGVRADADHDEFETIGLDRRRRTEDWVPPSGAQV